MVPPLADQLPDDLFECGLCSELVLEPTVVPCCGNTFCQACLKKWVLRKCRESGVPRCPHAGCEARMPLRLPGVSRMLAAAVEALFPEELERRRLDGAADQDLEEEQQAIPGNFALLDEVAASRDLTTGVGNERKVVVPMSGAGFVVGRSEQEDGRVTVKFEDRMDGAEGCLNVTLGELVRQLPARFGVRLGQRVVAARDLMFGPTLGVRFGVHGTVLGSSQGLGSEDRINIQFDSRADGQSGDVSCLPEEVAPACKLAGGFELADSVVAARDLFSADHRIVLCGTRGRIMRSMNDLRVSVQFERREDNLEHMVNVTPCEIMRCPP
ncbi:unnamed protein product [Prorocentrum cordatum]|uniref:RING-type domain-containing protein n=1 Tax=Prorocentrum cordatum TaxID=2364126 RepID=A0ABN9TLE7_9DINO|nr:unnamed protein product [Polarella glacialis]